eukprot:TRINITY_DN16182_c0_g2_i2.p1 TRINITY_DN16182_c0_g2~~TRINITY_DN16182_c0_g2_i2.p1  ORF type:complete len:172 (+),score=17.65 TRINITY_DN16182_c0_g2_i2:252-767(+)
MKPKKVSSLSSCQQRSLNRSLRKREMVKIMDENKAFLRRLQAKKSHYNVGQWNEEHKSRTKMLHHMGEYPYQFNATSKVPLKLPTVSNRGSELSDHKESTLKRKTAGNSSKSCEAELRSPGAEKTAVQKTKSAGCSSLCYQGVYGEWKDGFVGLESEPTREHRHRNPRGQK